jgi:splicing factor 3B subunit 3
LVLSIGETVEEVTDSGFLATSPTLGCGLIGDDSIIQVIYFLYNNDTIPSL